MNKVISRWLFSVLLLFAANAFGDTFDWQTAVDNGATVTQTVNGVTATFSTSNNDAGILSGGGSGTTGDSVWTASFPPPKYLRHCCIFFCH